MAKAHHAERCIICNRSSGLLFTMVRNEIFRLFILPREHKRKTAQTRHTQILTDVQPPSSARHSLLAVHFELSKLGAAVVFNCSFYEAFEIWGISTNLFTGFDAIASTPIFNA